MIRITIISLLVSLAVMAGQPQLLSAIRPLTAQASQASTGVSPVIYVAPQNITNLQMGPNSTFTIAVNISQAPPINTFSVLLLYNSSILRPGPTVDYSGNVLGSSASPITFCIDAHRQLTSGTDCPVSDHIGVIRLSLAIRGNLTQYITIGTLFHVTFTVASKGLAQFHLLNATLTTATGIGAAPSQVQGLTTLDGYFTNLDCPASSGRGCRPPTVRISYSPNPAVKNSPTTFNATVTEHNPGAVPLSYYWTFGDGGTLYQPASRLSPNSTIAQHPFQTAGFGFTGGSCAVVGTCLVTLTIYDNETVSWTTNLLISISNIYVQVVVGNVVINHKPNLIPGTTVHITADIVNNSSIAVNASLTISLESIKVLGSGKYTLAAPGSVGGTQSLNATWDTGGFFPRAYDVIVKVSSVTSTNRVAGVTANNGYLTTQNSTSRNVESYYVILISPLTTGTLSLSLLQTTGLGILILVALGVALARFTKKPSYEKEPL
jgi:hypothetical protein